MVTLSGSDHYLGPHGTKASRLQYDRLIGEWLTNGRYPLHSVPQDVTVIELCARYWKFARGYYDQDGRDTKVLPGIKCALRYLLAHYKTTPAPEFVPLALKAVRQRMVEDGHSRRYINDHVDRIRRMFKWAVAEQLLPGRNLSGSCGGAGIAPRANGSSRREGARVLSALLVGSVSARRGRR